MIIYLFMLVVAHALWISMRKSSIQPIIEYAVVALVIVSAYLIFDEHWIWITALTVTFRAALHDVIVNSMEGRKLIFRNGGITDWIDSLTGINPLWMKLIYFGIALATATVYYFTHNQ